MQAAIVIPVRYGSTRFPGKPLATISGKTLLQRVWELASAVQGVSQILVATDDDRIVAECDRIGAESIMTSKECRNGSERCYEALERKGISPEIAISFQGDAPLIPPVCVETLIKTLKENPEYDIVTPAVELSPHQLELLRENKSQGLVSGTTVVCSNSGKALYFSKSILPFSRSANSDATVFYKHLGIYAYRLNALTQYSKLPPGILEESEGLEQLRLLENDMPIQVVKVNLGKRELWSIDNPSDIEEVERIISEQGELV